MKLKEANHYKIEGHNPNYNDPLYLLPINPVVKEMRYWQPNAFNKGKDARFFAVQAFCGSGKTFLQIVLGVHDVVASGYKQKQLVCVPQQHIGDGFAFSVDEDGDDLAYISLLLNKQEYQWTVLPEYNCCIGYDRVQRLKTWLLTPANNLRKGMDDQTIGGLTAVCCHATLIAAWKSLTPAEQKQAVRNLTLRIDEAHHIKHVFLDVEDMTADEKLAIDYDATELGRICRYILNTDVDTCKLHLTTATMYRGDRKTILSAGVRGKFVEYNLDWIDHFKTLGIKSFYLQYEEYDHDPIKNIIKNITAELGEKHYIVIPSTGNKWRDAISLQQLLKELYKLYPKDRVLDLVSPETQDKNKEKLLAEPKVKDDNNPSMFDAVVVCMLGREGTDWCPCSRIHNSSVEGSITLAVQTAGRVFRRYDGKTVVKIYHYVKRFAAPKKGIGKRELFSDRTNALLVCMLFDEMTNPIIIPALPEQGNGKPKSGGSGATTLVDVFGDQYESVKVALIEGYDSLEEKTEEALYELADRICDDFSDFVTSENRDAIKDAMVVRIIRTATPKVELKGINVAWLRENGFDKVVLDNSIYFADCTDRDWSIVRKLLKSIKAEFDEMCEYLEQHGLEAAKQKGHRYYNRLFDLRRKFAGKL